MKMLLMKIESEVETVDHYYFRETKKYFLFAKFLIWISENIYERDMR
jgi:hypothetical protein